MSTEPDEAHIFKVDTKGELTVFRENSHGANGLLVDPQGRLVACEGALGGEPPRITRTDLRTGTIEILADGYEGMPFKGTNDLTIDNKGRLYFTDPAGAALYRIEGPGQIARVLAAPDIRRPNGLQISPDDKTLYVIESGNPSSEPRMIRAFDLRPDGTASRGRTLFDFAGRGGNGASVDVQGNLYIAEGLNRQRRPVRWLALARGLPKRVRPALASTLCRRRVSSSNSFRSRKTSSATRPSGART